MSVVAYVGCGNAPGDIHVFAMDPATGSLTPTGVCPVGSPVSFLAAHPGGAFVYVTNNRTHQVTAMVVDPASGLLSVANQVAAVGIDPRVGANPAYAEVDRAGQFLLVANYAGHTVNVFRIQADGRLGALVSCHSAGKNAHCVRLDPAGRFALVPYLGSDLVAQYLFDSTIGALGPNRPASIPTAPGQGPRHLDFHPNARWLYLSNELGGTVNAYAFDPDAGTLHDLQSLSALPAGYAGQKWSGDIHVAPSGRFLYVANRGHDSLACFSIDAGTGRLALLFHEPVGGRTPRQFSIDASGRFLFVANQDSNNVVTFGVDRDDGRLTRLRDAQVGEKPYFVSLLHRADPFR